MDVTGPHPKSRDGFKRVNRNGRITSSHVDKLKICYLGDQNASPMRAGIIPTARTCLAPDDVNDNDDHEKITRPKRVINKPVRYNDYSICRLKMMRPKVDESRPKNCEVCGLHCASGRKWRQHQFMDHYRVEKARRQAEREGTDDQRDAQVAYCRHIRTMDSDDPSAATTKPERVDDAPVAAPEFAAAKGKVMGTWCVEKGEQAEGTGGRLRKIVEDQLLVKDNVKACLVARDVCRTFARSSSSWTPDWIMEMMGNMHPEVPRGVIAAAITARDEERAIMEEERQEEVKRRRVEVPESASVGPVPRVSVDFAGNRDHFIGAGVVEENDSLLDDWGIIAL